MKRRETKCLKFFCRNERASVTIEAIISLFAFIVVMFFIISFITVGRIQMKVSHALTQAAKDISQYSYYYEILGLRAVEQGVQNTLNENSRGAKEVLKEADNAIANIELLTNYIADGKEAAVASVTVTDGTVSNIYNERDKSIDNIGDPENLKTDFIRLSSVFSKNVVEDPVGFIKGLLSIGVSKGMSKLKAHVIGGVIGKALCKQYLTDGKADSQEYLTSLGVVNGLDGMNFGFSKIFSEGHQDDICLVVVYTVNMPVFSKLQVTFAQSATTRAWFAGDMDYEPKAKEKTNNDEEKESVWDILGSIKRGQTITELIKGSDEYNGFESTGGNKAITGYNPTDKCFAAVKSVDVFATTYYDKENGTHKISNVVSAVVSDMKKMQEKTNGIKSVSTSVNGKEHVYTIDENQVYTVELFVVLPENIDAMTFDQVKAKLQKKAEEYNITTQKSKIRYTVMAAGGDSHTHEPKGEEIVPDNTKAVSEEPN